MWRDATRKTQWNDLSRMRLAHRAHTLWYPGVRRGSTPF